MSRYIKETHETNDKIYKFFAFLLGLLSCNNVIYAFQVGNTKINIIFLYAAILISLLFITSYRQFNESFKMVPVYWALFGVLIILSGVLALIYFNDSTEYLSRYVNGIIDLILELIILFCVLTLKNKKSYIVKGLFAGVILNLFISLVAYITFRGGNVFTLTGYFPQGSFYLPKSNFRSQGLFLEPSHLLGFLISVTTIVWSAKKRNATFTLIFVVLLITIAGLSTSGNIPILAFVFILYYILSRRLSTHLKISDNYVLGGVIGLFIICVLLMIFWEQLMKLEMIEGVIKGIQGSNLSAEENRQRTTNMLLGLELFPSHPFGVGWNMSHSLFEVFYGRTITLSTFSFLITLLLETGIIGTLVYIVCIFKMSWPLMIHGTSRYQCAVGVSVLGVFMVQVANGYRFIPFMFIIFGLALIELYDLKKQTENRVAKSHVP